MDRENETGLRRDKNTHVTSDANTAKVIINQKEKHGQRISINIRTIARFLSKQQVFPVVLKTDGRVEIVGHSSALESYSRNKPNIKLS